MFTINIRDIVAVGRGEMKWKPDSSHALESSSNTVPQLAQEIRIVDIADLAPVAKEIVIRQKINNASNKDRTAFKMWITQEKQDKLDDPNQRGYFENLEKIVDEITQSKLLREPLPPTAIAPKHIVTDYPVVADRQFAENADLINTRNDKNREISEATHNDTIKLSDTYQTQRTKAKEDKKTGLEKDGNGKITLQAMKRIISDLDGNGEIESKNSGFLSRVFLGKGEQKYIIGERQVTDILDNLDDAKLNNLAARLGASLPWNSSLDSISIQRDTQINNFRKELIHQATALNVVGKTILGDRKAATGLVSLVNGKDEELKQKLLTDKDAINKIQELVQNDQGLGEAILGALLKIGIMLPIIILSHGMAMGYVESRDITADGEKGGFRLKKGIGTSGSIVGSIDAIGLKGEVNWNDPSQRVIGRTKKFLDSIRTNVSPENVSAAVVDNITDASRDNFQGTNKAQFESLSDDYHKLQSGIIQQLDTSNLEANQIAVLQDQLTNNALVYNGKVEEIKNIQFKGVFAAAGIAGLVLGLSGSKVSTSATLDANLNAAHAETDVNRFVLTPEKKYELLNRGTMSYVSENGIEIVTIKDVKMTPDLEQLRVSGYLTLSEDGKTAIIKTNSGEVLHTNPRDIVLTDGSHVTYYNFSIGSQKSSPSSVPAPTAQDLEQAKDALEGREKLENVGDGIYRMSRNKRKYPAFDRALMQIGNKEFEAALTTLGGIKNDNISAAIVEKFKDHPDQIAVVNTFTYGAAGVMKNKTVDVRDYKNARGKKVMAAEAVLGNKTSPETEQQFLSEKTHTPTQLSEIYKGQGLAVSVYATPKGGTHRIDKYDGSVLVSQKTVEISDEKVKDIILTAHRDVTEKQMQAMNKYLGKGYELTLTDYENVIKTGNLPGILSDAGYSLAGKPHIVEARAMIRGNICANKTEAIVYPLLKGQSIPLVQDTEETYGLGSVLATEKVSQADTGLGGGIPWKDLKAKSRGKKDTPPETPPETPEINKAGTITSAENATGNANGIVTNGPSATPGIAEAATVTPTPIVVTPTPIVVTPIVRPGR